MTVKYEANSYRGVWPRTAKALLRRQARKQERRAGRCVCGYREEPMRLTPKQADLIDLMRGGGHLTRWKASQYTYAGCQIQLPNGEIRDVNSNVVTALTKKGLIKRNHFDFGRQDMLLALTHLGRAAAITTK
jgi:hypothetical protein